MINRRRREKLLGALLLSLSAQSNAVTAQSNCAAGSRLAVRDTTLIDVVAGAARAHQTILISCGRIDAVGPAKRVKIPAGTAVIDGRGLFASPGLIDAHAHNSASDSFRRAYLAYGVTTVRNMSGDAASLEAVRSIGAGQVPGPSVYLASPIINGEEPEWKNQDEAEAARAIVSNAKSAGYEYVKTYFQLKPGQFDRLAAASSAAGMRVVGHVPRSITLDHALQSMWSIEHLTGFDDALEDPARHVEGRGSAMLSLRRFAAADLNRIPTVAQKVSASSVWQVPTLFTYDVWTAPAAMQQILAYPTVRRSIGEDLLKQWMTPNPWYVTPVDKQTDADRTVIRDAAQVRRRMVRALYDAGAKLAVGTDAGEVFVAPGLSLHQEMKIYAELGIPAPAILRMATLNGAQIAGHEREFGSLEAGKRADLLILRSNPLVDLRTLERPAAVIAAGRQYPRAALNAFLGASSEAEIASAY